MPLPSLLPRIRRHGLLVLLALLALPLLPARAQTPAFETIFYMRGSGASSLDVFEAHAEQISIIAPQAFSVERDGVIWGHVDPRVLAIARAHGVRVMPLIVNPGFDQQEITKLLHNPEARARAVRAMVDLAERYGFWGWQFDFENIHISDRDALTAFYRQAAEALHANGFKLSIAVVPTNGRAGPTSYHRYMRANWRGSFDMEALAEAGDFISLMTYAQHGSVAPPGPIAGLPWVEEMLTYALEQGVPPEKISLGVPTYSGYWYPDYDPPADASPGATTGAGVQGTGLSYERARGLIEAYDAELHWLLEQGVYCAFWPQGGVFQWIFLEGARSFEAKLDLMARYDDLRGISVWVLGTEDPRIWEILQERR